MAITYIVATNIIQVTGYTEGTPCNFTDIYNADKAGTLSLHDRNGISAVDGAAVAVTRALRPADYVVLGGSSGDLYITVTNWTNMTTATIRITGTDRDGNAQTEDIVVTANGTSNTTKWFKTVTHTQVTVFTKSDSGSFDYELIQGQWGVVTRQCSDQYCFDAGLQIGDGSTTTWFKDTSQLVTFRIFNIPAYYGGAYNTAVLVKSLGNCIFGNIQSATDKVGKDGCALYFDSTSNVFGIIVENSGNLKIYATDLKGPIQYGVGSSLSPSHTGNLTIWSSSFGVSMYIYTTDNDIVKSTINKQQIANTYGIDFDKSGTLEDLNVYGSRNYGAISSSLPSGQTMTIKNSYVRDCTNLLVAWSTTDGIHNFVNLDTNTWLFYWSHSGASGTIWRQYEFDLRVIDKDENNINGATIKIWDLNNNLVVNTTTNASGVIATQTLNYGYYNYAGGNTPTMKTPHTIQISKVGYETYKKKWTIDKKTDWTIALHIPKRRFDSLEG